MAMGPPAAAYDRAITIFSPEGKLYQVMYASEAVKQGWTSLGLRTNDFVILAAEKRRVRSLLDISTMEKISRIDDHIGVTFAGIGGDGRVLIDYARLVAARHRLLYGEPAAVEYVVKAVADVKQMYTQHGGVRPFGVSLILGGVDEGGRPRLFKTDPAGQYFSFYAIAIGMGEENVNSYLEKNYSQDMSFEDAVLMVLKALVNARVATSEDKREDVVDRLGEVIELGYIKADEREFKKMSSDDIASYSSKYKDELLKA